MYNIVLVPSFCLNVDSHLVSIFRMHGYFSNLSKYTFFFIRNKLAGFSLDVSQYFVESSLTCFLRLKTSNDNNNPD